MNNEIILIYTYILYNKRRKYPLKRLKLELNRINGDFYYRGSGICSFNQTNKLLKYVI